MEGGEEVVIPDIKPSLEPSSIVRSSQVESVLSRQSVGSSKPKFAAAPFAKPALGAKKTAQPLQNVPTSLSPEAKPARDTSVEQPTIFKPVTAKPDEPVTVKPVTAMPA